MNKLLFALIGMTLASVAGAKLPPLSEDAQAKAAEAKDKTAWSDKVAAYQLCLSQDKVVAYYRKTKGAEVKPTMAAAAPAATAPAAMAPAAMAPAAMAPAATAPAATAPAAPAVAAIPACQDPGPYVAAQAATKVGVADSLPVPAAGKPPAPGEVKK